MQLSPMPSEELLAHGYVGAESDDYVDEEPGQRETARAALELIERYAPHKHALLDLGCWVGFLLAEARARGWERTLGVEPSAFASAYARDDLRLDVITGDLFAVDLPAGDFDAIAMGDVIEHLIAPGAALERVRELLVARWCRVVGVAGRRQRVARTLGRRWWSVLPTHVQYFTRILDSHLARTHRVRVAAGDDRAEGVHGRLLPWADRRLLARGRTGAGRRSGQGASRGADVGARLPRPDGGDRALPVNPRKPPQVAVVVATRDRPEHLQALLAGLREQTLSREAFEVIVVDDGSEASSTQAVLADEAAAGELLLRTVRHDAPVGPASARNSGWRRACRAARRFHRRRLRPVPAVARARARRCRREPRRDRAGTDRARSRAARAVRAERLRTRARPAVPDLQHRLPAGAARAPGRLRSRRSGW